MENENIINLDSSNADHCLSRFVAPPNPTPVIRVIISEGTKHKMVVGLYLSIGIIILVGIISGTISYYIRNKRRQDAVFKLMHEGEEYTAEDMDCLSYAYRSHQYFSFLNKSSNPSLKKCIRCEKEADHAQLVRIARNMSERAKRFGRSQKVEDLIAKGRRFKMWDKFPVHVAPGELAEADRTQGDERSKDDYDVNDDVGKAEGGIEGHTCKLGWARPKLAEDEENQDEEAAWKNEVDRKLSLNSTLTGDTKY